MSPGKLSYGQLTFKSGQRIPEEFFQSLSIQLLAFSDLICRVAVFRHLLLSLPVELYIRGSGNLIKPLSGRRNKFQINKRHNIRLVIDRPDNRFSGDRVLQSSRPYPDYLSRSIPKRVFNSILCSSSPDTSRSSRRPPAVMTSWLFDSVIRPSGLASEHNFFRVKIDSGDVW